MDKEYKDKLLSEENKAVLVSKLDINLMTQEIVTKLQALGAGGEAAVRARGRPRAQRRSLAPRVAAGTAFDEAALRVPREGSGFSATLWARSRLSMTMLRFFGLRASEVALLCLKDLIYIKEGLATSLDIQQPKTGRYRKVSSRSCRGARR